MDYGRLFLFMAAATAVMAIGTHLWCWVYSVVRRMVLRRELAHLCEEWNRPDPEEEALDLRRTSAPPYRTYEQFRADVLSMGVPIDDILDRCNGKLPPKAAEIQKADPAAPPSPEALQKTISGPVLATTLITLAVMTCLYGCPSHRFIEALLKSAKEQLGQPPQKGGA